MNENIVKDNIIYTNDTDTKPDPKGVGHFYYTQMLKHKDTLAQIDGYTKTEDTFESLLQRVVRTALTMQDKGLKPGDFISLCTYNHLNSAIPHIASYFTGTIMAAIDPSMTVQEAVYLLKMTLPKIIFVTPVAVSLIEEVVDSLGTDTEIVVFGESTQHTPFNDFLMPHKREDSFKPMEINNLDTVALVFFSSGSSGTPKGICHSHRSMLSLTLPSRFSHDDRAICSFAYPYWASFATCLQISIQTGVSRIVYPMFNYDEPWAIFYQHVDQGLLNPLQAMHMVRSERPNKADLKNVKVLRVGGGPITLKQLGELKLSLPHTRIVQMYGQSEIFKYSLGQEISTAGLELMKTNVDCVGTVVLGHCYKIVDTATQEVVGPNKIGELLIKSPSQFVGYLNQDSSECFDSDGWLRTGDLFYYNENLCFYFVDRIKESFKFYSYHISPVEIENVILQLHPVDIAVVVGIPHETAYNLPMAVVKLKPNAQTISAEEIIRHVENKLPDKKRLRGGVKFVESFPLTSSGKISRYNLRRMILNNEI